MKGYFTLFIRCLTFSCIHLNTSFFFSCYLADVHAVVLVGLGFVVFVVG